ncbi:MAG: hypothetical protein IPF40_14885 [Actinomycetales bacterium]|uniref:Replicative DNA helicase DnaB n=1 Tax=Candidatus Phosphoribacter hodrii TaxID=2953743 RepID=A0A935CEV8_9MICO|nr:hypothetical protein [Candidatus Phosphoribacter hodrii]
MGTRVCRLRPPRIAPRDTPGIFCSPHRWTRDTRRFPHGRPAPGYAVPRLSTARAGYPQGYPHGVSACSTGCPRGIHRVRLRVGGRGPRVGEPPGADGVVSTFAQVRRPVSAARFPRVGGREQTKEGRSGEAVSIQELFPGALDGPGDDRLPPQDVHAEQSVLGSMLLSKDAIADAVEVLRGVDFYRPAHESIYEAILDLYGRGEPADAVTVADELTKRGALARVGGGAFLHQLISSVPTAANAGYYAHIVAERAVLRRLVEAGTRIVQLGYAQSGGDVEDIVNAAQAEVYSVSDKRGGEDYTKLGDILEPTVDEIEVASGKSGEMTGVPTGFTDLDALTNGLHPGQMIVLAARPAMGKALALDTPLATPDGWTTMGEVAVGDLVMGADGRPTRVVAATEVMVDRPCYEVEFSDGSVLVADAEHQWLTDTRASRRSFQAARDQRNRTKTQRTLPTVKTTEAIAATLRTDTADQRLNHSVANAAALELDERELPLSPYVLGAWLGDGNSAGAALTSADAEMVMLLEAEGLVVRPQTTAMRYSLTLPIDPAEVRACVVCGDEFTPKAANVVTCGRSCGGRAKGLGQSAECPDCGEPSFARTRCRDMLCRPRLGAGPAAQGRGAGQEARSSQLPAGE